MPPDAAPQGASTPVSPAGGSPGPSASPGSPPAASQAPGTGLSGSVPNPGAAPAAAPKAAPATKGIIYKHTMPDGTVMDVDISGFKHVATIDGRQVELPLERLLRLSQFEHTSRSRMEEHQRLTKEFERKQQEFSERAKKLSDPETLLSYLVDQYGDKGIFDAMAKRMAAHERFSRLPEDQKRQILAAKESERRHQQERAEIEREKAKIEQFKAERAAEQRAAQVNGWKREWPNQFKAMGLPVGESTETVTLKDGSTREVDPVFRDLFNRTMAHKNHSDRLKLGWSIQQCQQEAAREVKAYMSAAERRALARREQAIGDQPGRPQPSPTEGVEDNVIPMTQRSAAKGPESTSDFLDRLKNRR